MTWPFVSRRAYAAVRRENARLWRQLEQQATMIGQLIEHTQRMDRADRGLKETAPPAPKPDEPMPDDVLAYIEDWPSGPVRERVASEVQAMYEQTGSWQRVLDEIATEGA